MTYKEASQTVLNVLLPSIILLEDDDRLYYPDNNMVLLPSIILLEDDSP